MTENLQEGHLTWLQRWKKAENLDTVRLLLVGQSGSGCSGSVTGARLRFAGTPLGDVAPIYLCKNRTGHCCDNKDPDCFTPGGCFCDSSCRAFGKSPSSCEILVWIISWKNCAYTCRMIRVETRTSHFTRDDILFLLRAHVVGSSS